MKETITHGNDRAKVRTFRDIMAMFGPHEFHVETRDGLDMWASCWTDDDEITIDEPAAFAVGVSWSEWGVDGRFDDVDAELDELRAKIESECGVKLESFDYADGCFYQV